MKKNYLIIKNKRSVTKIEVQDIMYILRDGRRLIVSTREREYVYYAKMSVAEKVCGEAFFKPLDRCIVNMEHLKSVDVTRRRLVFRNGDELFLGRDACSRMRVEFYEYLVEHSIDFDVLGVAEEEDDYS